MSDLAETEKNDIPSWEWIYQQYFIICDFPTVHQQILQKAPFLMELSPPVNPAGLALNRDQPGAASAASIPHGRRFSRFMYPGLQNAEAGDSSLIFLFIPHESLT